MKLIECWTWDSSKKFALYWVRPVLVCSVLLLTIVSSFTMFLTIMFVYMFSLFLNSHLLSGFVHSF
jgi:hypothetical protein